MAATNIQFSSTGKANHQRAAETAARQKVGQSQKFAHEAVVCILDHLSFVYHKGGILVHASFGSCAYQ
jgi:hypothetical protein